MNKLYLIGFHVGRRVFNRYFTTKDKALAFSSTLFSDSKVRDDDITLVVEPIDKEAEWNRPKGGKDPQPEIYLVCRDSSVDDGLKTVRLN